MLFITLNPVCKFCWSNKTKNIASAMNVNKLKKTLVKKTSFLAKSMNFNSIYHSYMYQISMQFFPVQDLFSLTLFLLLDSYVTQNIRIRIFSNTSKILLRICSLKGIILPTFPFNNRNKILKQWTNGWIEITFDFALISYSCDIRSHCGLSKAIRWQVGYDI